MWIVHSLIANVAIISIEYIYRKGSFQTFFDGLPFLIIPILISQYSLFHVFRDCPKYLLGWAVFTAGNVALRFVSNAFIGEPLSYMTIVGITVILLGAYLIKI